jgi:tRNA nucleotidyltransferase/poly(A) polymerase
MHNKIRKNIQVLLEREHLKESMKEAQKKKLVSILNNLEFKDDIINADGEIYAVGGIVRDAIMNEPSDDLDIVVRGIPYDELYSILSKYGKATDTSHEKEEGDKDFGSTKFVSNNEDFNEYLKDNGVARDIDVMLPRKDAKDPSIKGHKGIKSDVNPMYSIEDDLGRRDITINAIAMDLSGNLISKGTGLDDIKSSPDNNGVIKAVSEDAFVEDPLRMLRAVRFNARYNYDWDGATIDLIKQNVHLLSDKSELPKERFLMEFEKMIGKSDLGRAVKLLVELGMYESIFGIKSKIDNYDKFKDARNVAEFAYMMFENEPKDSIVNLIKKNITNSKDIISYVQSLILYEDKIKDKDISDYERVNFLSKFYKLSKDAMLNSDFIKEQDRKIINKLNSGQIPKDENELALKGQEFVNHITRKVLDHFGDYINKRDGIKMGRAKKSALQAIYAEEINNNSNEIKDFLESNLDSWLY